jgi:periplasmic protein TonB
MVAIRRAPSRPLVVTAKPARSMEPVSPSETAPANCGAGGEVGRAEEDRGAGAKLEGSGPSVAPPSSVPSNIDIDIDVEAVRMAIDRHLVYPLKARRMGWIGRVVVAFEIDERGVPGEVRVASSSGFGSLDDAAVEAVRSAAPFDAPGRRVGLSVPVAFRLGP